MVLLDTSVGYPMSIKFDYFLSLVARVAAYLFKNVVVCLISDSSGFSASLCGYSLGMSSSASSSITYLVLALSFNLFTNAYGYL